MKNKSCMYCKETKDLVSIFKKGTSIGEEEDFSRKVICKICLKDSEEYGVCNFCSQEGAYCNEDLTDGYCKEHYDEVVPVDEEEADAWSSLSDYYADPSHWRED